MAEQPEPRVPADASRPAGVRPGGPARRAEFDAAYAGTPPWDIGRPQPALHRVAERGQLCGRVLDVGCGTGEHALMAAGLGLPATGVDSAPRAIATAQRKARERGLAARFLVHDALRLAELGERFDVALDCGLFHVFDDDERVAFADGLRAALVPGGRYHMLCFSDRQPGDWGPRRVSQEEIRASFSDGWRVDSIEPSTLELTEDRPPVLGWLATIIRA